MSDEYMQKRYKNISKGADAVKIAYMSGEFKFKYKDIKFSIKASGDAKRLFDVLASLLILEHAQARFGADEKTEEIEREIREYFSR